METTTLFFATNRKHEGKDRWHPTGYGKTFSADGMQNLRFGKLSVKVDDKEVKNYLDKKKAGRAGDGEGLSKYLSRQAKTACITSYEDMTADAEHILPQEKNSSYQMFQDLKAFMENSADVIVFIHGYNVSWEEAVGGALSLQYMLNRQKGEGWKDVLVVLFSWPSDGSMMPFAAYRSDRSDAEASGHAVGRAILKLRDFLLSLHKKAKARAEKLCEQEVHLLCHSMGNFVLQNALQKLADHSVGPVLPRLFDHIFLCAADVDDTVLEPGQPMARLHEVCRNVSVYTNRGDVAMLLSDHTKGQPERLGHMGNAHPYLVHNKVHQVDCSLVVKGAVEHSYYAWATVNDDIRFSIEGITFDDSCRRRKRISSSNEWILI